MTASYMHRIRTRSLMELGAPWTDAQDADPAGYDRIVEDEWDHELKNRGL